MDINEFIKSYWNYYLELEKRMEETRRYVEYDESNFETYSSNYLMLFQTVCSEIDVVGKEIAAFFNHSFDEEDEKKSINRWWFEIQDNLTNVNREVIYAGSFSLRPWDKYRVAKVISQRNSKGELINVTKYNLQSKTEGIEYSTPKWWNAYNKVKHKRLKSDIDGVNYKKANLYNLANAFAALYLLEFEFMREIGTNKQRLSCQRSDMLGMDDLENSYVKSIVYDENEKSISFE